MLTNKEAIEILRDTPIDIRSIREDDIHTLYATAQNMAIDALSADASDVYKAHEDWKAITIKGEATCISTRDADIVAWMPLPEPYREDGEA